MTEKYLADRSYRLGRGDAYMKKIEKGKLHEGELREFNIRQRSWRLRYHVLRHRLQMLSALPSRRRQGILGYYTWCGFRDEFSIPMELRTTNNGKDCSRFREAIS
jgi:hypothetical protein